MASVSSSDRQRNDDRVQKLREEFDSRESEATRRKNQQVKRQEELHNEDKKRLTDEFQREISSLRENNNSRLTEKDHELQKKIDDIKSIYKESLKKKSEDFDETQRATREAYSGELKKEKQLKTEIQDYQAKKFNNELLVQDKKYQNNVDAMRESMHEGIEKNKSKLNQFHEKELGTLVDDRSRLQEQKRREEQNLRSAYEHKLSSEQRKASVNDQNWSAKYKDTVRSMNNKTQDNLANRDLLLKTEIAGQQKKYQTVIEKKTNEMDQANESFKADVAGRYNRSVRSRDSQIDELKNNLNNEQANHLTMQNALKKDLDRDFNHEINLIQEERSKMLGELNDLNHVRVDNVKTQGDSLLRKVNREKNIERSNLISRHREDRALIQQRSDDHINHVESTAAEQIEKMKRMTTDNHRILSNYYDDSLDEAKLTYDKKLQNLRDSTQESAIEHNERIASRVRDIEKNYNRRISTTVQSYEEKINRMNENFQKDLQSIGQFYNEKLSDREKGQKSEKSAIEMKYETRIANLNDRHSEDVERIERKHREEIQNLATKMSNYSKKA